VARGRCSGTFWEDLSQCCRSHHDFGIALATAEAVAKAQQRRDVTCSDILAGLVSLAGGVVVFLCGAFCALWAQSSLKPRLNLKHVGKAFLLPFFAPSGAVFDPPIDLRQFKADVVPYFLGLIPLVPQNLLMLSFEFAVEQRLLH
jgi:hypothetical protein